MPTDYPVSDLHIHIQPWRQLKPAVMEVMRKGKEDHWARLIQLMEDPAALLEVLDASGIDRVGLINYPSPDLMGFDDSTNDFAARYASADPRRLLPFGGVHPRFTKDPEGDVDRLISLGFDASRSIRRTSCFRPTPTLRGWRSWAGSIVARKSGAFRF